MPQSRLCIKRGSHTLSNSAEMVINMKKYLRNILIGLSMLIAMPSMRVLAAGRDGFRLDDGGTVTVVSQHAAKEEISSLGFSLLVESENADKVEFQFEESNAEILEFRYDENAKKLNIYVAGTEALFAEGTDSLTIGRVIVQDENGGEASAKVSVVEDSLQYVYGAELKTMQELDLPEAVQLGPVRDDPSSDGEDADDNDDNEDADDNDDDEDAAAAPAVTPAPTASPVRTPRPTAKPVATTAPTRSPSVGDSLQASNSTPKPSPSSSPESTATPAVEESVPSSTPSPSGGNTDQSSNENKESKGIDIVFVIAIAAIVIFAIVAVIAFVVLKKLPKKPKE